MTTALAIDLGGTKVDAALVADDGTIDEASRTRRPTGRDRSAEELADAVREAVRGALAQLPAGAELAGAGIGSAGPIDIPRGAVMPYNLTPWHGGYPLRDLVQELVPDVPVTLRIDGLCITLAEHWVGAARGADDVLGMIVSTGVGGGLILGGHTIPGPTGNAGHIGHIEVAGFDDPCTCGGSGCLEAVASGPNTVRWARERGFEGATGEDLGRAYAAGDGIAVAAVRRAGTAIGRAIASASALLDLEIVAIGGGFANVTPDLFEFIREPIAQRVNSAYVRRVRVVPSMLSGDGPLIGAAALVHRSELVG
ncbi:ROK family protein [Pseudolysinimonas kribbensis]|uniref:Sugar kinase n=1 Tax=Pseudolysinimonas kribbensis TaxID=433641 RepID=A0ABQ6K816_9MICO|nr:ROK family protein [Pseudolysinimonas kribbensis]GMA96623.1 sugar kinase [Pseudolysinimonas kribbensis]